VSGERRKGAFALGLGRAARGKTGVVLVAGFMGRIWADKVCRNVAWEAEIATNEQGLAEVSAGPFFRTFQFVTHPASQIE
jgi:hypothetical protein